MVPAEKVVQIGASGHTPRDTAVADQIGGGIITMLKQTAQAARETADRAVRASQRATAQLEQSQERVKQLETQLKHSDERAQRAEQWLLQIRKEVEEEFARYQAANESPSVLKHAPEWR